MSDRRCPHCGERIPSFSINCPSCYRSIPREEPRETYRIIDDDRAPSLHRVNRKAVMLLALIPGVFGLFGLGHFYQRDCRKGAFFLMMGVFMMSVIVLLNTTVKGPLAIVMTIGLMILFIGAYLFQAFDAIVRSLFRM